ncbi:MAG: helix-turn-helix domain-containing protein [Chloroflexota bacterium]
MRPQAINALENLGFSTYEAKAYLGLLSENPINGYKLSKITGVPRSRIYETADRLVEKGFATKLDADPVEYAPLGIEGLNHNLKQSFDDHLTTLNREVEMMAIANRSELLWNIQGYGPMMSRIRTMLKRATRSIYLVAWAEMLEALRNDLTEIGNEKKLIILSCGSIEELPGTHYNHAFEQELVAADERSVNLVIDGREVLIGSTEPADQCVAFWSQNQALIQVTEEYIRHEIYIHKIIDRLGPAAAPEIKAALLEGLKEIPYEQQ